MPSGLSCMSVCKGPEVAAHCSWGKNEGPVGTRLGDAVCQIGSDCRIWWGLVRKGPGKGVNPEAVGAWQLCVLDWWIAVMSEVLDLGCRLGVTTLLGPDGAFVGTWMGRC